MRSARGRRSAANRLNPCSTVSAPIGSTSSCRSFASPAGNAPVVAGVVGDAGCIGARAATIESASEASGVRGSSWSRSAQCSSSFGVAEHGSPPPTYSHAGGAAGARLHVVCRVRSSGSAAAAVSSFSVDAGARDLPDSRPWRQLRPAVIDRRARCLAQQVESRPGVARRPPRRTTHGARRAANHSGSEGARRTWWQRPRRRRAVAITRADAAGRAAASAEVPGRTGGRRRSHPWPRARAIPGVLPQVQRGSPRGWRTSSRRAGRSRRWPDRGCRERRRRARSR